MILQAIAGGETDPSRLAAFAVGRVRASQAQWEAALTGHVTDHHRFLLQEHLTQIGHREQASDRVTTEMTRRFTPPPSPLEETATWKKADKTIPESPLEPAPLDPPQDPPQTALTWAQAVVFLSSIPGISERIAIGIFAEIGPNRQPFPTASHLASWAGICPGNQESAGQRLSGKTRTGHPF